MLVIGGVYLKGELPASPRAGISRLPPAVIQRLGQLQAGYSLGDPGAPVQVVELSDYQCPACAAAHRVTWPILERHVSTGQVRYTAYDLPLPRHANAIPAALLAGCVAEQDADRFWILRHRLFAEQKDWADTYPVEPPLLRIAAAGADTTTLRRCLVTDTSERVGKLRQSWEVARSAGITFTPAWAVNGKVVRWAALEQEIEQAIKTGPRQDRRPAAAATPRLRRVPAPT